MFTVIAEAVIEIAALVSGIGGVAFIVYFLALVWREHRDEVTYLDDYRRERLLRTTGRTSRPFAPEDGRPALSSPSPALPLPRHP